MSETESNLRRDIRFFLRQINDTVESVRNLVARVDIEHCSELEIENSRLAEYEIKYNESVHNLIRILDESNSKEFVKQEEEIYSARKNVGNVIRKAQASVKDYLARAKGIGSEINSHANINSKAKLPKIALPKFSGEVREFLNFKSLFETLVHNEESILPVEKLYYLKQSLTGAAEAVIRDIDISEEAYALAWSQVKDRYFNKRLIIKTHLSDLFSIPKVKYESELRELLDKFDLALKGLRVCGESIEKWNTLTAYMLLTRLDDKTQRDFENSLTANDFPSYDALHKFVENRAFNIESGEIGKRPANLASRPIIKKSFNIAVKFDCIVCNKQHLLKDCIKFKEMSPTARVEVVRKNFRCFNCFNKGHSASNCVSMPCKLCHKKHNTLLHLNNVQLNRDAVDVISNPTRNHVHAQNSPVDTSNSHFSGHNVSVRKTIVLPSALVSFQCGKSNGFARILLDSCSQPSLISDSFVRKFKLKTNRISRFSIIKGVGNSSINSRFSCSLKLRARTSPFEINIEADVVPASSISYSVKNLSFHDSFRKLHDMVLADTVFNQPLVNIPQIDILLGAEYFEKCLRNESQKIDNLMLRNTHFGWVISGPVICDKLVAEKSVNVKYSNLAATDIDERLRQFWEVENVPETSSQCSQEQADCVKHFESTYSRVKGQFNVRLPFKNNFRSLANNHDRALVSFLRNEKFMNSTIKRDYVQFMDEYELLGDMSVLSQPEPDSLPVYFLPHRAVLRPNSCTTKLRVVFNASAKTKSGLSLNDVLMTGPVIQPSLIDILIRFRRHLVAFSADIEKMYRCILVHPDDRKFQCVLWRKNRFQPIQEYALNTVTYGTSSASFIATKCLEVLGKETYKHSLQGALAIMNDFYMDDLLTGSDTIENAVNLQATIHEALATAKFNLRKYQSNCPEFLNKIEPQLSSGKGSISLLHEEDASLLGLCWRSTSDHLCIKLQESEVKLPLELTKRVILSHIARIFDPLGIVAPITIRMKILLQRIWKLGISWDTPVTEAIASEFRVYLSDIRELVKFSISRPYTHFPDVIEWNLVGYADASEVAYSAVVYLRSVSKMGEISSNLVCAKTRVAPIKELTIPRLELQAALLLAELISKVGYTLECPTTAIRAFSDSTTVLAWLAKPAEHWKPFVANRVRKIVQLVPFDHWGYVNTKHNPADLATRGISVKNFLNCPLWTHGPIGCPFDAKELSTIEPVDISSELEAKKVSFFGSVEQSSSPLSDVSIVDRFSSFIRLLRVVSFIFRFYRHLRNPSIKGQAELAEFTAKELNASFWAVVRIVQQNAFRDDFVRLKNGQNLKGSSTLKAVCPFVDSNGLMRVSGRICNSSFSYDKKHPVILPGKSHFTRIYIRYIHNKYFHATRSFIAAFLYSRYHFVGGAGNEIKRIIKECVVCIRYRGETRTQLMADLPPERVRISRPFSFVGVDFAGPFECKCINHRSTKVYKIYAAVFVCLCTRAVHMEVVSSLSAEGFVCTLHRFIARRGRPSCIYSDNATNFVGTSNYLRSVIESGGSFASSEGISWKFIPVKAPHRGGIWEAAVKSAKYHLRRVLRGAVLNFEDYCTFFTRVEAILNSRPLCYKTTEDESSIITAGHFLIGDAITGMPESEDPTSRVPLSKRYVTFRNRLNSFWNGWSKNYMSQLQTRSKWTKGLLNLEKGTVVLIKDSSVAPGKWRYGLVMELFADTRGKVRTVSVRCGNRLQVQAVTNLIPLLKE